MKNLLTENSKAVILLALAAFGWGTNTIASKLAVGEVSPMMLIFIRWAIVAILLSLIYFRQMVQCWSIIKRRLGWVMLEFMSQFIRMTAMDKHPKAALTISGLPG